MDNRTTDIPSTQYTFHHTHPAQEARTSSIYYNTPTTNTLHPHRYIQTNQQRERILAFLYVFCTFQFTLVNNIMLFEKSLKNFFSKIDFRGEYCFHNMLYDSIQSKSSHTHPYINTYGKSHVARTDAEIAGVVRELFTRPPRRPRMSSFLCMAIPYFQDKVLFWEKRCLFPGSCLWAKACGPSPPGRFRSWLRAHPCATGAGWSRPHRRACRFSRS